MIPFSNGFLNIWKGGNSLKRSSYNMENGKFKPLTKKNATAKKIDNKKKLVIK